MMIKAYINMCEFAGVSPTLEGLFKFMTRLRVNGIRL